MIFEKTLTSFAFSKPTGKYILSYTSRKYEEFIGDGASGG